MQRLSNISTGLLAGLALAACASAPAEDTVHPLAMCEAMVAGDSDLAETLARHGADQGDFCACFLTVEAGLDEETRTDTYALMRKVIEMRAGTDRTVEDVAELLEDDRDGALYGLPEEHMKRGAQPIEDSLTKVRRDLASCRAS